MIQLLESRYSSVLRQEQNPHCLVAEAGFATPGQVEGLANTGA